MPTSLVPPDDRLSGGVVKAKPFGRVVDRFSLFENHRDQLLAHLISIKMYLVRNVMVSLVVLPSSSSFFIASCFVLRRTCLSLHLFNYYIIQIEHPFIVDAHPKLLFRLIASAHFHNRHLMARECRFRDLFSIRKNVFKS